jgi:hypothetical protein
MRFNQLKGLLEDNRTFSKTSDTARNLIDAIDFLNSCFTEETKYISNRATLLSICMLASRIVAQNLHKNSQDIFRAFVENFFTKLSAEVEKGNKSTDKELLRYQQAITSGSTGGDSIKERINILTKALSTFSPKYSKLLGAYSDARQEAVQNITELATAIQQLIYEVNSGYAAKHGMDLFKLTNESAAALHTFSIPCHDSKQFGAFIDALYFLVYEGSGSCNRLPSPPPEFAMDVKFLRTLIRHDVDHGSETETAKKRVRNASVFEKYSGKKTTGECSSEDLLSTQIKLLNTLILFLASLKV